MSETPQQPGTPEPHEVPQNPGGLQYPGGPRPPGTQENPAAQAAAMGPGRRSTWNDAVSTTGGKAAVVVAAASLGLVVLLLAGLAAAGLARHLGDGRRGPWSSDAGQMPGPGQMDPGQGQGKGKGQGKGQGQRGPGTPEQLPPGQDRRGAGELPGMGMGLGMGVGGALHGEAVIPGDGGTATRAVLFQRGQVTAVTADKLTVKSTDGFSATYTIGADSRDRLAKKVSTLATGDEVTVVATKADATTIRILRSGRTGDS